MSSSIISSAYNLLERLDVEFAAKNQRIQHNCFRECNSTIFSFIFQMWLYQTFRPHGLHDKDALIKLKQYKHYDKLLSAGLKEPIIMPVVKAGQQS